jgi:hypothetical protein
MPEHNQVSPPPVVCLTVCYSLPRAYLPTNKFCQLREYVRNMHHIFLYVQGHLVYVVALLDILQTVIKILHQVSSLLVVCLTVCYSLPPDYLPTNKICQIQEIVTQHNTHGWRCSCASKIAYMISRECLYFFRYDIATIFAVELFRFLQ